MSLKREKILTLYFATVTLLSLIGSSYLFISSIFLSHLFEESLKTFGLGTFMFFASFLWFNDFVEHWRKIKR